MNIRNSLKSFSTLLCKNIQWMVSGSALAVILLLTSVGSVMVQAQPEEQSGIHKIKHIIIIMQENRSFDEYFGTFPGADGYPMKDGAITVCNPDPRTGQCQSPYHDTNDRNGGGPHTAGSSLADIANGKMDGFILSAEEGVRGCKNPNDPVCTNSRKTDVMGYHDGRDIPNYWAYARTFVLQDHMFEPVSSWSLPSHLFEVSAWSAYCTKHNDPASCINEMNAPGMPPDFRAAFVSPGNIVDHYRQQFGGARNGPPGTKPIYAWTDITWLLHAHRVSWSYYVFKGSSPDCDDGVGTCTPKEFRNRTEGWWNPLPYFDTVKDDGQLSNIKPMEDFYKQAHDGTLPAVSWVSPSQKVSEHPPALVSVGQTYVTSLINAVMQGPDWKDCVIFLAWDDWGGFYDHLVPPVADINGYGIRVPAMVISPYAKSHYIDHQVLSFDAYLKFIEDDFLGGARLDPKTDGRPDPRPTVREDSPILGDITHDFDFDQKPLPPLVLPEHPATDLVPPAATAKGR